MISHEYKGLTYYDNRLLEIDMASLAVTIIFCKISRSKKNYLIEKLCSSYNKKYRIMRISINSLTRGLRVEIKTISSQKFNMYIQWLKIQREDILAERNILINEMDKIFLKRYNIKKIIYWLPYELVDLIMEYR